MEPVPPEAADFDLRAYWRTIVDFRWMIVLTTVVVGAATIVWTMQQPRIYEASTTIEYDPNPATPMGPDVADPISGYLNAREYYETQNRKLRSRSLAMEVARELGLHEDPSFFDPDGDGSGDPPSIEAVADLLRSHITVRMIKDTRIVALSVRDRKPERAQSIANTYARLYVSGTRDDRTDTTVNALSQLGQQLDELRTELERSELALHEFKQGHNILSVSMEDRQNLVAGEIEALNAALTATRQRRIEVAARLSRLREAAAATDETVDQPIFDERSSLAALRQSLREKLAERQRESVTYGSQHPTLIAIEQEVSTLRDQLERETSSIIESAAADLREVRTIENGLRRALEEANQAGLALNLREIEYRQLFREQENNSKAYQVVLDRRTETGLSQPYRPDFAEQLDPALEPDYPVAPNRTANAIAGLVAGFLLGVLVAFGIRFLDRRIRTPEMLEALGATLLGVLPAFDASGRADATKARKPPEKRGRRRGADYPIVVHDAPMSAAAECCRTVRTNLTFMTAADGRMAGKCLLVTGSLPQEGKTTVSTNIAASFAQSGKKVLIIDADLRKPKIHQAFDIGREVGLTSYIVGDVEFGAIVQRTRIPGLDAIVSGPVPPNPAELLHTEQFRALLNEARSTYDVVVFDSPPLGAVTDAAIVASQVDGTILVARAEVTTRDAFQSSTRQLKDVNARVLGSVLNAFDMRSDSYYGKGYYYRQYGGYYTEEAEERAEAAE